MAHFLKKQLTENNCFLKFGIYWIRTLGVLLWVRTVLSIVPEQLPKLIRISYHKFKLKCPLVKTLILFIGY